MPIPVRQQTIDVVKQLVGLEFRRNLRDNEFIIHVEYATGYTNTEGRFVVLESNTSDLRGEQALWVLGLRGSQGTIEDPTLAEMFTQIFDGIETGQVVPPQPEPATPDLDDPIV